MLNTVDVIRSAYLYNIEQFNKVFDLLQVNPDDEELQRRADFYDARCEELYDLYQTVLDADLDHEDARIYFNEVLK